MNSFKRLIGIISFSLLFGCSAVGSVAKFNELQQSIKRLSPIELEELKLKGHMSASLQIIIRSCGDQKNTSLCNDNLFSAANRGHPRAMSYLSTRMTFKELGIYNLKESYTWRLTQRYFIQPIELSKSEYVRSYQQLGDNMDLKGIEYMESVLSEEEVAAEKIEAKQRAKELWVKLQDYCKTWKDKDYVCWYEFMEPDEQIDPNDL